MKFNEFNAEIKDLQEQVDEKITTIENETEDTTEAIEKMAMTYEELDQLIAEKLKNPPQKKFITVKAELAAGSPVAVITDDEIKSGTFIRIYAADEQTRRNLDTYTAINNIAIIGNQCLILLNGGAYESTGNGIIDLTFNLLYRIYKSETSEAKGFIHIGSYIGEVINNG